MVSGRMLQQWWRHVTQCWPSCMKSYRISGIILHVRRQFCSVFTFKCKLFFYFMYSYVEIKWSWFNVHEPRWSTCWPTWWLMLLARHQLTLWDTGVSLSRGVPVYSPAISGTDCAYPWGMARLSASKWLATYRDGLPTCSPISVLTGPDVE